MKGRAPGTPKSDDPAKRKRKRVAREKNLCDVKIRITEYAPPYHLPSGAFLAEAADEEAAMREAIRAGIAQGHTQRLWTIQRVNGQGGNRKGVAGPHRHTLARSDEIKKNTVQRFLSKKEQEVRKAEVPISLLYSSHIPDSAQKVVKRKPTGHALQTTKRHTRDHPFQFHAACFWYTHPFPLTHTHTHIPQPLLPARLDRPRGKEDGIPVHRNRPLPKPTALGTQCQSPAHRTCDPARRLVVCGKRRDPRIRTSSAELHHDGC